MESKPRLVDAPQDLAEFLAATLPHPYHVLLTAIHPTRKGAPTECDPDIDAWIAEHSGTDNCYWAINPPMAPQNKKAEETDILCVLRLHVDLDPRKPRPIEDPKQLHKAERARILRLLFEKRPEGVPEPSFVIDSGGGYQAFWDLEVPIEINGEVEAITAAKAFNKQLERLFGGDACHNLDRVMRCPWSINIPNQNKVAKGRERAPAKLIHWTGAKYSLDLFQPANTGSTDVEIPETVERLKSVDDLDQWKVPDRVKVVIVMGHDPDQPKKGDDSRSAWLFDCVCQLVRANVPDGLIYSVITDPGFKIAESVLEASNPDRYAKKQIRSAKEAAESEWLARLNQQHAVIKNLGGRCLVVSEVYDPVMDRYRLTKQSFTDFKNAYCNKFEMVPNAKGELRPVPVGKWWLDHGKRREFDRIIFAPELDIPGAYNLWQGFGVAATAGDRHLSLLRHIAHNICREKVPDDALEKPSAEAFPKYHYLLGWLANTVQNPAQPGYTAIVMRGKQGTGKSFFAKAFGKLFGRHFLHVSHASQVGGNFNGHLRDTIVAFGDECFYATDARHTAAIKTLVTEETIVIETKGVDAESAPNYCHLILATNGGWAVRIPGDDRRFFMIDVSEDHRRDEAYFAAIDKDLEAGGYESLLHLLRHYSLDGWHVREFPLTEEKGEAVDLDMLRQALRDSLDDGIYPWAAFGNGKERTDYFTTRQLVSWLNRQRWDDADPSQTAGLLLRSMQWPKTSETVSQARWRYPKTSEEVAAMRAAFTKATGWGGKWHEDGLFKRPPEEGGEAARKGSQ